jgi:hypothetical protein
MELTVGLLGELDRNIFPACSSERETIQCREYLEKGRDRMLGNRAEGIRSDALPWKLKRTCFAHLLSKLTG